MKSVLLEEVFFNPFAMIKFLSINKSFTGRLEKYSHVDLISDILSPAQC